MSDMYVRPGLQLHREVEKMAKGKKTKSTKLYHEGEKLENLTDKELKRYQHLIESEEQKESRLSAKKSTRKTIEDK